MDLARRGAALIGLDPVELIRLQLRLEGVGFDAAGDLMPWERDRYDLERPAPGSDPAPRLYVARHAGGFVRWYRHDVPRAVREALAARPLQALLEGSPELRAVLACGGVVASRTLVFARLPDPADFPLALQLAAEHAELAAAYDPRLDLDGPPVHAVVIGSRIVSACQSSREDDRAAEAWVRTLPGFRRRGYARQAVCAWAYHRKSRGKVAFYSHGPENEASAALARSLGLTEVMTMVSYA